MPSLREAATQALEALEADNSKLWPSEKRTAAITALKAALAEPVQDGCDHCNHPLYAAIKCKVCKRVTEPVQEPVAWQERQARRMREGVVTEWTDWYPCRYRTLDEARSEASDHIPYEWRPLYTAPPQRKPLTEEEIAAAANSVRWSNQYHVDFARAIERAHQIGEQP